MKVAYFDCFNGAAGDMIVGALIDAGADFAALREAMSALPVGGFTISADRAKRGGFSATRFEVRMDSSVKQPHRHLKDVLAIYDQTPWTASVRDSAKRVFRRLAEAEAAVHGIPIEKVHFHEVGAVDALVDVGAAAFALHSLGVDRVICSPVAVGSGTVRCEHGVLPVPAPATARLLEGVPLAPSEETGELTTPTGAALLTTFVSEFGPLPSMTLRATGQGAGSREGVRSPNVIRVLIGDSASGEASDGLESDQVFLLETNLDDATPATIAYCMERLLEAGALDVYSVPIVMKKGRPGTMLCVICQSGDIRRMEDVMFIETPTLGVRRQSLQRSKLRRNAETVQTEFGPIRIKVARRGAVESGAPEYEDCRAAARTRGVPLHAVISAAFSAWNAHHGSRRFVERDGSR